MTLQTEEMLSRIRMFPGAWEGWRGTVETLAHPTMALDRTVSLRDSVIARLRASFDRFVGASDLMVDWGEIADQLIADVRSGRK